MSVSALNYLGIKLINSVNFTLIIVQLFFIIIFIVLALSNADLNPESLIKPLVVNVGHLNGLLSGAAVLCLAFLGFDAIATMAEESNNPSKTLPKAILWTFFIAGSIFLVVSYVAHLACPDWSTFIDNEDIASLYVAKNVGGHFLYTFFFPHI